MAKEGQNEVIAQVKSNQKTLLEDCIYTWQTQPVIDEYSEPVNKERNRIESRTVQIFNNDMITYDEEWKQAKVIVKVYRERKTFDTASKSWKDSNEMAFYISTILFSAKEFCQTIRDHWGIENRNHRVKDGSMKEDHSRIRVNPDRIAILRSFALNIMRANGAENISTEMYKNCLNF